MQAFELQSLAEARQPQPGSSIVIAKALESDFERVYPLLLEFRVPGITREDWKTLFTPAWKSPEDFRGYLILKDDVVEGFLGLLFSTRTIKGNLEKFCNMTSWIVHDDYRTQSLRLLLEALKLRNYTLTNFTASQRVAAILKKFAFAELPTSHQILFPIPSPSLNHSRYRCTVDPEEIRRELDEQDRLIFDDHRSLPCRHVLISSGSDYCYVVVKNKVHRHVPFARAHYISNRSLFQEALGSIRNKICWKLKVAGLMVDERYLDGVLFNYATSFPQQCLGFFKSATVERNHIDTLYSEMILLHD